MDGFLEILPASLDASIVKVTPKDQATIAPYWDRHTFWTLVFKLIPKSVLVGRMVAIRKRLN